MIDSRTAPYAALLLRLTLGGLFLTHASLKLFVFTPAGTAKFFGSIGLPPELAYVVIAAEILAGIALILGVFTRWVALAATPFWKSRGANSRKHRRHVSHSWAVPGDS